ncbi:DUF2953 domain-containing protein [Paenibacillus allorhizosphaerae]|uniref:DUF2953 domain-containing protein n=1 Tax=Paenibacillus allorhizosphaerae TaxID=2849866 RepID=A0ABM8VHC2_9BACL|nr:DUF2953 domain-containing protein [Paenibacillus allorhizosphaerae]CAG7641671.1 hypothetical protein PAECIP111802_02766 [Paenibacillus allorhizosphaerae]
MIWLWVAGILCFVLLIILFSKIRMRVSFNRQDTNDDLLIDVSALFGLIHLRYSMPVFQFKGMLEGLELKTEQVNANAGHLIGNQHRHITIEKVRRAFHNVQLLLQHCFHFHDWLKAGLSHVHCDRFVWKTSIGLDDAANTAISVGTLWGLKTSLLGYVFRFVHLETEPKLQVMPMFNQMRFEMEAVIEAYVRFAFALKAGILLLIRILKVKDGWKTWRTIVMRSAKRAA